jgi:uncharacterized repeat protein (TIGR01451 family)
VDVVTVNLDFPSLTIAKTTGSGAETGTAEVLQPFTWKVVVTNSSLTTATAKGVDVRDTMPADWVYVPGSAKLDGVATGNPVIVPHAAGDDLAWTDLRDVVPGAFLTVTYDATPQLAAGSAANPQVNVASATASDVSSSTGNLSGPYAAGPDPASATVAKPVLAISKTPDGAATRSPVATSFTITITNSGTVAARSLIVTDTLPTSQLTYANGTATAAPTALASEDTSVPGTITWTIATLAAGASTVITMPVNVKPGLVSGTTIVNGGSVISRELTVAVSDTGSLVVGASSDLSLTKVISNPTPVVGQAIDYTITVSNAGLDAAAGVTVLDVLPPQVTFVSASGNGTYNALTGIWTIGAMPALATKTIQINVTVNAPVLGDPSPVVNVAEINASSAFDPDSTPNNGIVGEDDRATASFVLAPGATVGDFVWQDSNGDGRQTGGEPGVAGVTVRLLNSLDVVVATTSTNGAGAYGFGGLAAGTYRVEVVIPGGGWQASPVDQGTDTGDSDINALTGRTPLFTLVAGQNNSTLDAGLFQPASVGDRVWADTDGDGVQDPGELGVAGVTVKLLDGAGVTLATTVTSATGIYGFATLIAGSYRIELVVPSGYSLTGVDAGADDALDSDIVAATSRTPTFTPVNE